MLEKAFSTTMAHLNKQENGHARYAQKVCTQSVCSCEKNASFESRSQYFKVINLQMKKLEPTHIVQ